MIELKLTYIPWNDYGFYTHYKLFFSYKVKKSRSERNVSLGRILIVNPELAKLKKEEEPYHNSKDIEGDVDSIGTNYISLGYSKEYYSKLYSYDKEYPGLIKLIKEKLNDIVLNETVDRYKDYDFFKLSFTRAFSLHMIQKVYPRIVSIGNEKKDYYLKFKFKSRKFKGYVEIDTKVNNLLSNNIYAVIGNNGVGKTKLLKRIIKKLKKNNYEVKSEDEYFDINRILLLTMSSFDDHENYINDDDNIEYIGIKDYNSIDALKSTELLLLELYEFLKSIKSDENKYKELEYILNQQIATFDSFLRDFIEDSILSYEIDDERQENRNTKNKFQKSLKNKFQELSSGQANLLYMTFSLIAVVEEDMFAVIDEPELYLHPLYVMGYINLLNYIFERRNAIAFISTHSPLIIQQIPSNCVYKITFDDIEEKRAIEKIDFPCFGENLSIINDRIFNIKKFEAGFYRELASKKIEELEEIYENNDIGIEAKIYIKRRIREVVDNDENSSS
ncbi:AAA family ATPase [Enterococcus sp. LJL51]|uniref:AAA family ATPase n=1 Tax=Enterococcus sp. LJL51 TaxID=3416656 RepID=UPI003CE885F3